MLNFSKILWVRPVTWSEDTKPILVGIRDGLDKTYIHWEAGQTHTTWNPDEYVIVKEFEYSGYESINNAGLELNRTYAPKPQPPSARLGWISPNGEWYPCGYCCHSDLESILIEINYGSKYEQLENDDAVCEQLEDLGWISVAGGPLVVVREDKHTISEDAKNTLRKVVEEFELTESLAPDINWDNVLMANPEGYRRQLWGSLPSELCRVPSGQTCAQRLRDSYEVYFGDYHKEVVPLLEPTPRIKRLGEHTGD